MNVVKIMSAMDALTKIRVNPHLLGGWGLNGKKKEERRAKFKR